MPMPITPPMPAAGAGANMLGNLMGNKPGANVGVVPSPNATAATPAQLPSAAKIAAMFGMPKGTNARDNSSGLAKQTSNAPAAPNVASRNPPMIPTIPYEGTKLAMHGKSIMLQRQFEAKQQFNRLNTQHAEPSTLKGQRSPTDEAREYNKNLMAEATKGKTAALALFKLSGWGQTIGAAAKGILPGAALGAVQGAMDPNGSMLSGAATGAMVGAGGGALHGHMMQAPGAVGQAYQKGVGMAKQQFGTAKNWLNSQMAPQPQAPIAPQGFKNAQLREFFSKLARN